MLRAGTDAGAPEFIRQRNFGAVQKVQKVVANPAFLCGLKQSHACGEIASQKHVLCQAEGTLAMTVLLHTFGAAPGTDV